MAIDWSGYQIPGYLAAQDYRNTSRDVGSALGAIFRKGTERQDVDTRNMGEAIRGQGRSFYKDSVDHALYDTYDKWLEAEGGRYLQVAEAGGQFQNVGGEYQMKQPGEGGEWLTMGEESADDDGTWDPYAGGDKMNQFEKEMQQKFLGDWSGGQYGYRTSMSPLKAFFSKERYRPVSNLYQDPAKTALAARHKAKPHLTDWSQISQDPASLGWFPGKQLSGQGILGKLISGKGKSNATTSTGATTKTSAGGGIKASGLSEKNAAGFNWYKPGSTKHSSLSPELSFAMDDAGVDAADFKQKYEEHLSSPIWKKLSPEEFALKTYNVSI